MLTLHIRVFVSVSVQGTKETEKETCDLEC